MAERERERGKAGERKKVARLRRAFSLDARYRFDILAKSALPLAAYQKEILHKTKGKRRHPLCAARGKAL